MVPDVDDSALVGRTSAERRSEAHVGVRLELFTVVWMILEAAIAIGASVIARSLLLVAFGLDSIIELISGGEAGLPR